MGNYITASSPVLTAATTKGSIGNKIDAAIDQTKENVSYLGKATATAAATALAAKVLLKDKVDIKGIKPAAEKVVTAGKVTAGKNKGIFKRVKIENLNPFKSLKFGNESNKLRNAFVKVLDSAATLVGKAGSKLGNVKNSFVSDLGNGISKLATKFKGLTGKGKVITALGTVATLAMTHIFANHKYNQGRIDQKYDTRAQVQNNIV